MTFKELAAQLSKLQGYTNTENQKLLSRVRNKPFWIWNEQEHQKLFLTTKGNCCFNDIVGRPTKNGEQYPLFDYEKTIFDILFSAHEKCEDFKIKDKHIWILKSTGLGITELMLRIIAWLATRNNDLTGSQVIIVTGPNIDLAIGLIRRLKKIFQIKLDLTFEDKETVLNLNGCHIQAYPSNHIDAFRSLTNPKFILIDA